jgi:hypothetical protein
VTFLLWYLGGLATALFFNYALHNPNRISEEAQEKLNKLEDQLYRNSGH